MGNANTVTQYGFDVAQPLTSPTATGGPSAGNMGTGGGGNYSYAVSFVSGFGETPANTYSAYGVTTTGSMSLTDIPVSSDIGVVARNIYRTYEGGSAPGAYLTTLNDNVTTTYTDISNDSDLGGNPPLTNTASSYTIIRGHVTFSNPVLATMDLISASGISWDTATQVSDVDITFVTDASPVNGVTLPIIDGDTSNLGKKLTIVNKDLGNALNVWPYYGVDDIINFISYPAPYIVPPNSSVSFVAFVPGVWLNL